ncbi:MAG: hypothetical protein J6T08_01550 [Lentisphaeria bacterium]|nr:hypothetical protein [Lentisphaeria bacterium]
MRVQYHCSYCSETFSYEDDCRKHEIEAHAKGKAPKYEIHDIVKLNSTGYSYYVKDVAYFSNARNQWVYSLEGTPSTVSEDCLSLVCKKEDCKKLYESAVELANTLFGDKCADNYYSCFEASIKLNGHFLFTVPLSTDQVLEYINKKNKEELMC